MICRDAGFETKDSTRTIFTGDYNWDFYKDFYSDLDFCGFQEVKTTSMKILLATSRVRHSLQPFSLEKIYLYLLIFRELSLHFLGC